MEPEHSEECTYPDAERKSPVPDPYDSDEDESDDDSWSDDLLPVNRQVRPKPKEPEKEKKKTARRNRLWRKIFSESASTQPPSPELQFEQGMSAFFACQYEQAYLLFSAAARAGHADATARLGWCLYWGYGVKQSKRAAYRASQRALTLGSTAPAWTLLGVCMADRGAGVEFDLEEAIS